MLYEKNIYMRFAWFFLIFTPIALYLRLYILFELFDYNTTFYKTESNFPLIYNSAVVLLIFAVLMAALISKSKLGKITVDNKTVSRGHKVFRVSYKNNPTKNSKVQPASIGNEESDFVIIFDEEYDNKTGIFPRGVKFNRQEKRSAFRKETLAVLYCSKSYQLFFKAFVGCSFLISFVCLYLNNRELDVKNTLLLLFSLASGIYYIYSSVRNTKHFSRFYAFMALFPPLWSCMRMIANYLNLLKFINKSLYFGELVMLIFFTLFFMSEAKFNLIRTEQKYILYYVSLGIICICLIFTVSLPYLVTALSGVADFNAADFSLCLLELGIGAYIISRLFPIMFGKKQG